MSRKYTDWFEVNHLGGGEIEVLATFTVTPFIAQTYWQPAEGGEIEIESIEHKGIDILDALPDADVERITDHIANNLDRYLEDDGPDPDDLRDRMIDARLSGDDA